MFSKKVKLSDLLAAFELNGTDFQKFIEDAQAKAEKMLKDGTSQVTKGENAVVRSDEKHRKAIEKANATHETELDTANAQIKAGQNKMAGAKKALKSVTSLFS